MFTKEVAEEEEEEEAEEEAEEEETEEEGEAEEETEAEEEVRGSISIGNPFSFVIRSRQTLRDRPDAERRISLKRCLSHQDGATAAENRLVVQEMVIPL